MSFVPVPGRDVRLRRSGTRRALSRAQSRGAGAAAIVESRAPAPVATSAAAPARPASPFHVIGELPAGAQLFGVGERGFVAVTLGHRLCARRRRGRSRSAAPARLQRGSDVLAPGHRRKLARRAPGSRRRTHPGRSGFTKLWRWDGKRWVQPPEHDRKPLHRPDPAVDAADGSSPSTRRHDVRRQLSSSSPATRTWRVPVFTEAKERAELLLHRAHGASVRHASERRDFRCRPALQRRRATSASASARWAPGAKNADHRHASPARSASTSSNTSLTIDGHGRAFADRRVVAAEKDTWKVAKRRRDESHLPRALRRYGLARDASRTFPA